MINYIITTMKQQLSGSAQQIELARQVRKTWEFNPTNRVVESKKRYKRNTKFKKQED